MRQVMILAAGLVVLAGLLLLTGAVYVVNETQQVVITQLGEPRDVVNTPGLHFKTPLLQRANFFEKRFLAWDGDRNQLPTKDKRFIFVDTYARWRITDPLKFFQRLRDLRGAQGRLDDILDGETRNTIARYNLIEVVRATNREFILTDEVEEEGEAENIEFGRGKLTEEVLRNAKQRVGDLGIEILDFRFKRLNYVQEVQDQVFKRMISERQRIAEKFRSEGQGESARIGGEKERELKRIGSEAYREAQGIKGRADARAADIYAQAYNSDPEFYRFLKSMDVLKTSLDAESILMLGTDGELLRYLEQAK